MPAEDVPYWYDELPLRKEYANEEEEAKANSKNDDNVTKRVAAIERKNAKIAMSEAHYNWVEIHKLFTIEPKKCRIKSGEFKFIKLSYERHSVGTHDQIINKIIKSRTGHFFP